MMHTRGTDHVSRDEFSEWLRDAERGARLVYATGDLAYSAPGSVELWNLRKEVWKAQAQGNGAIFQRRLPQCRFVDGKFSVGVSSEYIFVKA